MTTWSDEIIPRQGAFFTPGSINSNGDEHFISILTEVFPTPCASRRLRRPTAHEDLQQESVRPDWAPQQISEQTGGIDSDNDDESQQQAAAGTCMQACESRDCSTPDVATLLRALLPVRAALPTDKELALTRHDPTVLSLR